MNQFDDVARLHREGRSLREIAKATGLSATTVGRRVHRLSSVPDPPAPDDVVNASVDHEPEPRRVPYRSPGDLAAEARDTARILDEVPLFASYPESYQGV